MKQMTKLTWATIALMSTMTACSNVDDNGPVDPTKPGTGESGEGHKEYTCTFDAEENNKDIVAAGWLCKELVGDRSWTGAVHGEDRYVKASGHDGEGYTPEHPTYVTTLSSPLLDLDMAAKKVVSFDMAQAYWKETSSLEILIEKGDVQTPLNGLTLPTASSANFSWVSTGNVDLSAYSGSVRIVFKYTGESGYQKSTTWCLDNFVFGKDVKEEGPVDPGTPEGEGSEASPYNVATIAAMTVAKGDTIKNVWVEAYIVGTVDGMTFPKDLNLTEGFTSETNIVLGDKANATTSDALIPVALKAGSARDLLNLVARPTNKGKKVKFKANIMAYFGSTGMKDIDAATITGVDAPTVGDAIFSETFTTQAGFDRFTAVDVVNETYNWTFDPQYGAKMAAYDGASSHATEDWLISPAIDLSSVSSATMTFSHTINKGAVENIQTNHTLWMSTDYTSGLPSTATWKQVTITTYPAGTSWTATPSGDIAIPAEFIGQSNVRFAFKYLSSDEESSTWQVKNVVIE